MKVEIWSDVVCPFCYIGKRKFEQALDQFAGKDDIEIVWKSFQLDPNIPEDQAPMDYHMYLSQRKRIPLSQVQNMLDSVTETARQVGLTYHMDDAKVVNTLNAHRIIQYAKTKWLWNESEEIFFHSYFTDSVNLNDVSVLVEIGKKIGLTEEEVQSALLQKEYEQAVQEDISQAHKIGVTGVPFFVFDRTYGVSWAQDPSVFLQTLEKSHEERKAKQPQKTIEVISGESCDIDGNCQ